MSKSTKSVVAPATIDLAGKSAKELRALLTPATRAAVIAHLQAKGDLRAPSAKLLAELLAAPAKAGKTPKVVEAPAPAPAAKAGKTPKVVAPAPESDLAALVKRVATLEAEVATMRAAAKPAKVAATPAKGKARKAV